MSLPSRRRMLLILPALPADAHAIAKVHIASWQAAYAGIFPDEFLQGLSLEQREAQWVSNLNGTATSNAVAELNGSIVGFVSFGPARDDDCDPARVAEIIAIYVAPDAWGEGVGSRLFDHAIGALVERSFETVTLWVLEANERARTFYENRGFVLDGLEKQNTLGPPLKVVRYRRGLNHPGCFEHPG
jgi:ribosomal protein S18 acetylase RimI-like enzyme